MYCRQTEYFVVIILLSLLFVCPHDCAMALSLLSPPPIAATDINSISSMTQSNKVNPSFQWCCTAFVDKNSQQVNLQHIAGPAIPISQSIVGNFDLTKSADWMEHIEIVEGRSNDIGGAGAYDTMRCDILIETQNRLNSPQPCNIWGQSYHLNRLQKSYKSILNPEQEKGSRFNNKVPEVDQESINIAMKQSEEIIQKLLHEAESTMGIPRNINIPSNEATNNILIQMVRLTLLWSTPKSDGTATNDNCSTLNRDKSIVVRGHACCNGKILTVTASPEPIVASVAAKINGQNNSATIDTTLPTRFEEPQHKVASWCRLRRQLETPNKKPKGVSEVLMVRQTGNDNELELLEGLSSNFFAIYKDGKLRTAANGVLFGYVRHLILESAEYCGMKVCHQPILLSESDQWKETFITSSSRLIYPISKILITKNNDDLEIGQQVDDNSSDRTELWCDPLFINGGKNSTEIPKWHQLLDRILQVGGYSPSHNL